MSQPVEPEDPLLRYYKSRARSLRPALAPKPPPSPIDAEKSANTAKEDPRIGALSEGLRKAISAPPPAAPTAIPTPPPVTKSPSAPPPPIEAPPSLTAAEQAELPSLPDLPMETPAAPRGLLGRMWDGLWRTVSLTGEEVFGDDTLDRPETDAEAAKREAAGKAELRRKLGRLPVEVREQFGKEAESIEDLSQRVMAYELAQRGGGRPEDAFPYLQARQGVGVDVTGLYAKLKDAAFRELRQQHPGVLTPEALAELRRRAETKAKADLSGYMVLPTGLPMVVRDVDGWKETLQGLPLALRIPLAIVTTPTDLVYRGTVSHRSVSKWSALDIFGRMAGSTPVGAAIEMVPKEDVFPMLGRSVYSAFTDLPWYAGAPALLGALLPDTPEGVTFQDLVDSPEMVDRLVEGSDIATAMGRIAEAVAYEAKGTPFESTIGEHPILTALALTIPVMIAEPDLLSLALGPIGIANDALKVSDAFSGVSKIDPVGDAFRAALRKAESTDIGDLRGEMEILRSASPEAELMTADQFAHALGVNPSLKLHYADHIKKRQKLIAEMSTLEAEAAKAASVEAKERINAQIAGIMDRIASDQQKMWEEIVTASVEEVAALKETIEATTVQKLKRKGATTAKPVKLRQKHIDDAMKALPAAEKELEAASASFSDAVKAREAARVKEAARKRPRAPLKSTLKIEEAFKVASDRLSKATAEKTRLERYKLYAEAKQQILPAFKHVLAQRRATAKLAKAPIKPILKDRAKAAKAAAKAAGKIDKAEAFLEIGPRFAEARRQVYRRMLLGHDALRSIADVPSAPLSTARRYENVTKGALAKLVFKPSKYGVSEVAFRDPRSAEQILNAALTFPEGAAAIRIADLDTTAFHRALDEKYGGMIVAEYRKRLKDPDLARIFAAPIGRKAGLSTDDVTKLRQAVDQLDNFAMVELKTQAGLLPALALLRQIEAAPARFYGNALTRNIRAMGWWARRYLAPTGSRWGQANEDLIRIEQVAEVARDTYQSDLMEISIILDPVKRQDAFYAYIDSAIPVDVGRGGTIGNATTGRSMWHDMGDYIEMKRALWEAAKGGKLEGVVEDTATGTFEQMLVADPGFKGLAHMYIAHGPGTPAKIPKTEIDMARAALKAYEESDSFRDFTDRFASALYGKRLEIDERERALAHGALAVAHMAGMKKAMLQAQGAFAGAITVPEAQAMNAMLTRATGGTEYDLDLALRTLERTGMTFLRDSKARGMFGRGMREINESSKRLVAVATDPTTGATHFLPKLLLDDLSAKVDNMIKEVEPVAERKGDPIGGFLSGLGSAWKRSVTVGFLIPKVRYTLAGVAIGDWSQVFAWKGFPEAAKLATRTLATHLPGYGRVLAYASRTLEETGGPGAKWVGSKLDALTSPVLNGVFLGKQGTVRLGERVYTFDELRRMLRDDGILESVTREELLRDVDQLARHTGARQWVKRWQHEIEAHAEMTQVRLRSMYYIQLLQRGADRKTARKDTLDALYNWKHGFAEWESATLLKLNVPFYRFFKLAFRQALQVQMEPFMRATDPSFYVDALRGRTKLSRYRQTALLQSAIPDWMATGQAWDENKEEVDELHQLSLMLTGRSDWAQGGRFSYASKLDPRERVYAREAFNKTGAYEMAVFPEMTPLMSMSWWLNLHGALATVMGWGAMGGAAGLGMAGPPMIAPRADMIDHLWEENFAQFAGPVGDLLKDSAPWTGGRATVSPGEALIGQQIERLPMMPQFFNIDYARESGRGIQANTFPVLLLRMLPFVLQLPDWATAKVNTRFAQGRQQGIEQALLHVLGLRRLYSRDPMADQEREIRRITSELQREVEVEQSRAGVPLRFGLFDSTYEPVKK